MSSPKAVYELISMLPPTTSKLQAALSVTTSKAPVTTSDALVTSSDALSS